MLATAGSEGLRHLKRNMTMVKVLQGKAALIVGGSRGIGAATVRRLAEDGADVAFSYVASADAAEQLAREVEALGVRGIALKADQADSAAVAELVRAAHTRLSALDILVISAGVTTLGDVGDPGADLAAFERQFAINVKGVATAVRTAVPLLRDGGSIVTVGSVYGSRSPSTGLGDYSASKAAVAAYSRAWARDLGSRAITVNVVQPGPIDTDMNPATAPHAPALTAMTALGRYGRADEVAAVIGFLSGPGGSYVSGATINVDGGMLA